MPNFRRNTTINIIKVIQNILLLLAWTIMFMHNLTPHVHHGAEVADITISDNADDGILDWMQRMFAQDLGEGHLEHCVTADDIGFTDLSFEFSQPFFALPTHLAYAASSPPAGPKLKPPLIYHPISNPHFLHLPLRAPPVLA